MDGNKPNIISNTLFAANKIQSALKFLKNSNHEELADILEDLSFRLYNEIPKDILNNVYDAIDHINLIRKQKYER